MTGILYTYMYINRFIHVYPNRDGRFWHIPMALQPHLCCWHQAWMAPSFTLGADGGAMCRPSKWKEWKNHGKFPKTKHKVNLVHDEFTWILIMAGMGCQHLWPLNNQPAKACTPEIQRIKRCIKQCITQSDSCLGTQVPFRWLNWNGNGGTSSSQTSSSE